MTRDIPQKTIIELITRLMRIQKQYAHEQLGARNDRRNEIKKLINRLVSEVETKRGD